ncbi:hypothetical protein L596_005146 [Steinernema carpocapsae]|uniref:Reverse transcriptase domain-containing protein n=1 Tax=Steinernema carpocapsae TaxID=34508 RepID=A0A4U8UY30_STECR|nr:hypothetical protein L596_005146 [Steinernema carpocapsae]
MVSTSPDQVSYRLLKSLALSLAQPVWDILTRSFTQGVIPSVWKSAIVKPILKKGDPASPANYRPISLTSALSKVAERFVGRAILKHCEQNNLFCRAQNGFLPGRSTTTALAPCFQDFYVALEAGQFIDIVFIDFSKAFDMVPHELLLFKLKAYGIRGSLRNWIKDFLSDRRLQLT